MMFITCLHQNNMNDKAHSAAIDGVGAILSWMAHRVVASITSQHNLFPFQGVQYFLLVFTPEINHRWNEKVSLIVVICWLIIHQCSHVPEDQKNLFDRSSCTKNGKTEKEIPSWEFLKEERLTLPCKDFLAFWFNGQEGSSLRGGYFRIGR